MWETLIYSFTFLHSVCFGRRVVLASWNKLESIPFSFIFWKRLRKISINPLLRCVSWSKIWTVSVSISSVPEKQTCLLLFNGSDLYICHLDPGASWWCSGLLHACCLFVVALSVADRTVTIDRTITTITNNNDEFSQFLSALPVFASCILLLGSHTFRIVVSSLWIVSDTIM